MKEVIDNLLKDTYYNISTVTDVEKNENITLRLQRNGFRVDLMFVVSDKLTGMIRLCVKKMEDKTLFYHVYKDCTREMQLSLLRDVSKAFGLFDIMLAVNRHSSQVVSEHTQTVLSHIALNASTSNSERLSVEIPENTNYEKNMLVAICKEVQCRIKGSKKKKVA